MRYCAGIDGGQSSTVCAIGDERGVVVARAVGPPAEIDAVVADALKGASLPAKTEFVALVAGISGYDEGHAAAPQLRARNTAAPHRTA